MRIYFLLFCLLVTSSQAHSQTNASKADAAEKIWEKVFKLGVGHDITVKTVSGASYHGQLSRIADNEFEIREVDLKQTMRWYYSEVQSVRDGYGPKNVFGKRHSPTRTDQVITAGGLGGILLLILLSVAKT